MSNSERYVIYCKECDDDRALIQDTDSGSYRCPDCDSIYYDEDGVFDVVEAMTYGALYRGEKLAGLVPEEDYPEGQDPSAWK